MEHLNSGTDAERRSSCPYGLSCMYCWLADELIVACVEWVLAAD